MKKSLTLYVLLCLSICIAFALTGCAQIQQKINADVQAVTLPDLNTALADATAANHASGITCWGGLVNYVNALPVPAAGASQPQTGGVATALELGSEFQASPQLVSLPPLPPAVHDACAGILLDDANLLAKLGITVGSLGKIKLPAVAILPQGRP